MERAIFGIIGCGGIAQSQHLPNLSRAKNIELRMACDMREDVLKQMQTLYSIPQITTDHKKLLADPAIQGVVIATKEDAQVPLTLEALAAGKHVYVEKPLAKTPAECEQVVAAQAKSGRLVSVGTNRRFAPAYRRAKELLDGHGGARNLYYRISDEYWSWGKHYPPGVRVIHEVCHVFDILRFFTGSDIQSVYCASARADDEIYTLKFANGSVATIMNSGYATMDMPKERLEAMAEKGGLSIDDCVEMRTFGWAGVPSVETFAGHTHPSREFTHKFLLEKLGADALFGLRRMGWELREAKARGEYAGDRELEKYLGSSAPHWNYMVDKGWRWALEHLADRILHGGALMTATPRDALAASQAAAAAIRSRESGKVEAVG